jgi:hypothetical protein
MRGLMLAAALAVVGDPAVNPGRRTPHRFGACGQTDDAASIQMSDCRSRARVVNDQVPPLA